ncbi:hypothetical protein ABZY03_08010 [Streptomyces klenkii]|uniref:hypothetical protein n=1 Tax=Streptomyces klenkii TaxID=1420899 RepID=UPI0033A98E1E
MSNAWTIVEAPLLRSVDVMQILGRGGRLGPVMGYPEASLAWWLVSDGAEEHLADLPQLLVRPRGWALCCPPPHQYMHGRGWLERPDGNGKLTSPVDLGAAFSWVSPIRMERSG